VKDLPEVENRTVFIAHRYPGSMTENTSISRAILCKVRKIQQFGTGAGFEPGARGICTMYSVAAARQLIQDAAHIAGFKSNFLSP